jgi:hypothetical protein
VSLRAPSRKERVNAIGILLTELAMHSFDRKDQRAAARSLQNGTLKKALRWSTYAWDALLAVHDEHYHNTKRSPRAGTSIVFATRLLASSWCPGDPFPDTLITDDEFIAFLEAV